ncbi:hypothetical protein [Nocardia sp. NPDC052566]|uniref:hypothetical protein n=1 Tax=Nocardia sp. NPDC052566 TaxID=3364330 RepID=UPI0037C63CE7
MVIRQDRPPSRGRRVVSLMVIGALPLAVALASTGTAAADWTASSGPTPAAVQIAELGAGNEALASDSVAPESVPAQVTAPVYVSRNSPEGVRAMPGGKLAPVDPARLHMPDPASLSAPVAPIAPPTGRLRAGDTQIDIPQWLTPEQAAQVNEAAAAAEAGLAQQLDSAGFEPTRSDRIAAQTVGTAAVGGVVGAAAVSPLAVAAGAMGGFIGAMAGSPFAPAGWVFGPMAGATAAVTLVVAPAVAAGSAIGAAVGAMNGYLAPAVEVPEP